MRARSQRSMRTRACATSCPHPKDPSFLITNAGTRLYYGTVWHEFDRIRRRSGPDRESLGRQVRMHDLRDVFVLRTLLGWYRDDTDVQAQLPLLATFLGHYAGDLVKPAERDRVREPSVSGGEAQAARCSCDAGVDEESPPHRLSSGRAAGSACGVGRPSTRARVRPRRPGRPPRPARRRHRNGSRKPPGKRDPRRRPRRGRHQGCIAMGGES